jgi:hypothetical protein
LIRCAMTIFRYMKPAARLALAGIHALIYRKLTSISSPSGYIKIGL